MAPARNGAAAAEGRHHPAHLPLWQASESLQRLYELCQELSSTWEALGAEERERLADTEAVATKAAAEAEARLKDWKGRSAELEARCKPLLAEAESGAAALGDSAGPLAPRLAEAGQLPVRKRVTALEGVLAELRQRARAQHTEQLELLGRRPQGAEADSGLASLGPQLARLREAVQERRALAARARASLQGLWRELGVQPNAEQDAGDAAIRAGGESYGVADAEHEVLMRRLAFWESQRSQRQQQQVLDRHGRIRELALAVLPQGELAGLSAFLEAHAQTSDAGPLQAKEQELEAMAEAQVQTLDQRRRVASRSLGRPLTEQEAAATTPVGAALHRLRALTTEVERLEGELNSRRNRVHEAARRARALWEELGEQPDERRDGEVTRVLAAGADNGSSSALDAASVVEAVEASCKAWEARREAAAEELSALRAELEGLGMPEAVRPFLAQHGTLRREDRATCRSRIQQLKAEALRAQEEPKKDRLRRLYDLCGLGAGAIEALYVSLEQAANAEQRSARLSEELETVERYAESVSSIVGQLRELKPEVPQGMRFQAAMKEPSFRKAVVKKGPAYRSRLLEDIGQWEAESRTPFLYDGANVKEWLLAIGSEETASGGGVAAAQGAAAPALPAELEAAAAKAMAALKAKLAAVKSMPPPFAMDGPSKGDGDEGGDAAKRNGLAGKGEQEKTEKEEKKKKKDKKDKGKKKKADRSKSRKRKGSDSSSESRKRKRSRSRRKSAAQKKPAPPSSSESQSGGSTSSQSQPKKKKKKAHSHRHNRRSKSKSRRRGK